jgi:hypothetical protein
MSFDFTGLGSVAEFAKSLTDRFFPPEATPEQKAATQLQVQELIQRRDNAVLETQKSVITSEMAQGDNFTKRARPSIVYFGLAAIGLVHVVLPIVAWIFLIKTGKPLTDMPKIELPSDFWLTWGGVCSIWVIGRSAEKRGSTNPVVKFITGAK